MLVFLDGIYNDKHEPNENYAREMMELFSLGADRGAYTEDDVREMARALTGWTADWSKRAGLHNFRFVRCAITTNGNKTVFGQTGNWGWEDAVRLCVAHPLHPSFFVSKLWSYFIPVPPDKQTLASLQGCTSARGYSIRAVVEAILQHPDFYEGPELVTPPVVYNAGLLRAIGRPIDTTAWAWLSAPRPASSCSIPPTSPAGTSRAGSTPPPQGALGNGQLRHRRRATEPVAAAGEPQYSATEDPDNGAAKARSPTGANPLSPTNPGECIAAFRRLLPARGRRRPLAAEPLPGDPPERAADADRNVPRHAGELTMAASCSCNDFTRSQLLRAGVAQAGRGAAPDRAGHAAARRHRA